MKILEGGQGSGNFGHKGRPGQQGGSGRGGSLENWFRDWETNPTGDPRNTDHKKRGFQKNELITELSKRSGLPYDEVNNMIRHWTHYAPGTGPETFFNPLVAEMYGVGLNGTDQDSYYTYPEEDAKKFLKAMRNYTQEKLPPGDSFTLYRAIRGDRTGHFDMKINPLSSWTTSEETARFFLDRNSPYSDFTIVKAEIPRSRIFGSARTGFGALPEEEIIVLGTPEGVQDIKVVGHYR